MGIPVVRRWLVALSGLAFLGLGGLPAPARGVVLDWGALASPGVVELLTEDADGDPRRTKVWIVLADDGHAYLRTFDSRWFRNLERDPHALLISGDQEVPVRVQIVEDDAIRAPVIASFREKYRAGDWWRNLFVRTPPKVLRLLGR